MMISKLFLLPAMMFTLMPGWAAEIYRHDFETDPGSEWSRKVCEKTPKGGRRYLGRFGPGEVTLQLAELAEHRALRLRFDLLLGGSWDGSGSYGPDVWTLSTDANRRLIYATFNCLHWGGNPNQSFPEDYPSKPVMAFTGSKEHRTLGYTFPYNKEPYAADAVYRFDLLIPHDARDVTFRFASLCEDPVKDQYWGLDHVRVDALEHAPVVSVGELHDTWRALAAHDPTVAYAGKWKMVAAGEGAVRFLEDKYKSILLSDAAIETLVESFVGGNEKERAEAEKALLNAGRVARAHLREEETRSARVALLLEAIEWTDVDTGKGRRLIRVQHLLRAIGSPSAVKLLERIESLSDYSGEVPHRFPPDSR